MTEMYQPAAAAAAAPKPPADKKKTASAVMAIPAPAKKITLYYLDTRDTSVVASYQDDGVGYAEVVLYVNGVVPKRDVPLHGGQGQDVGLVAARDSQALL
jgi:hypothetical protein